MQMVYQSFQKIILICCAAIGLSSPEAVLFAAPVASQNPVVLGSPSPEYQNLSQSYHEEQVSLNQQRNALLGGGASSQQIQAWTEQNAARFAAQQQRAQAMVLLSGLQMRPVARKANIPPGASQTLKDFLVTQASLANARAVIHNSLVQQVQDTRKTPTLTDLTSLQSQEAQLFQTQNATVLATQAQRSQTIAIEFAAKPGPVPTPIRIPSDATPQMKAFLTTQSEVRREFIQLKNQCINASPAVRDAELEKWEHDNGALLTKLEQETQALSQDTTSAN